MGHAEQASTELLLYRTAQDLQLNRAEMIWTLLRFNGCKHREDDSWCIRPSVYEAPESFHTRCEFHAAERLEEDSWEVLSDLGRVCKLGVS